MILEESSKHIKKTGGSLNTVKRNNQAKALKSYRGARDVSRSIGSDFGADGIQAMAKAKMEKKSPVKAFKEFKKNNSLTDPKYKNDLSNKVGSKEATKREFAAYQKVAK